PRPPGARRRWLLAAGAAAAAAVLVAGALALDGGTDDGGQSGSSSGGRGGNSSESGGGSPAGDGSRTASVALPYGGEGHTRDFGKAGGDRAQRPKNWQPWAAKVPGGSGPCAVHGEHLVCTGPDGGATGLRASDGERLWSVPGGGAKLRSAASYPAVHDGALYVTGQQGVTAYDLADGHRTWHAQGPGDDYAFKDTDTAGGTLYTTYLGPDETSDGLVTARRLGGDRKVLWKARVPGIVETPLAVGDRLYVLSNKGLTAYDTRSGKRLARSSETECFLMSATADALLCGGRQDGGVAVLDAGTLQRRRVIAEDVQAMSAPTAAGKDTLLLADDKRLYAYDVPSGRRLWDQEVIDEAGRIDVVGDTVLTGSGLSVTAYPLDGKADRGTPATFQAPAGTDEEELGAGPTDSLAVGGVLFLILDGWVISGYLPS
ncbi:hypothetical protein DY218_29260, partial [Streptomyces triticagri]